MKFDLRQNGVTIRLAPGESFILARKMLKGFSRFETHWIPPFPFGSPFFRIFYGSYFAMREVRANAGKPDEIDVPVRGPYARGNFHVLRLGVGERYYVSGHCIAGFSGTVKSLHTRIKFGLPYWVLKKHFFPVFEGPGEILMYGRSAFEETTVSELEGERVAAFDITRVFQPVAPQPQRLFSKTHNLLWSREVIWRFRESGLTVAEMHSITEDSEGDESFAWRWIKHALGLLKF